MNRDLQVGDEVILSPDTNWDTTQLWNPLNTIGVVMAVLDRSVMVKWEGYVSRHDPQGAVRYNPEDSDLIKQSVRKFKTRDEARARLKEKGLDMVIVDNGKDAEYRWTLETKEI